ncbi:Ig-like domain-containing protein [Rhodopirellula sp. MGV]|uniref:Ig-like domain-containing protein n=1 Tax=Rhodopirellula sp. MGV TaxID=2023130 RepID=UPI0013040A61|nr:Ig-like domain-containing protein [Rhodopirellula sp. MGV]
MLAAYVVDSTGGGDFLSIQAAINVASANGGEDDVIRIAPGTYFENLSIANQDGRLELEGMDGAGPGGENGVVIDGSLAAVSTNTISIQPQLGGYVALRNFDVTGGRDGIQALGATGTIPHTLIVDQVKSYENQLSGFAAIFAGDVSITHSRFDGNGSNGIFGRELLSFSTDDVTANGNVNNGAYFFAMGDIQLTNSYFNGNDNNGIYVGTADSVSITGSFFDYNAVNGINFRSVSSGNIEGTLVVRNGIRTPNSLFAGIYGRDNHDIVIRDTVVAESAGMGIGLFETSGSVQVTGVNSRQNALAGIRVSNEGTNQPLTTSIEDSTFESNIFRGAYFVSVSEVSIVDTTIVGNGSETIEERVDGGGINQTGGGLLTIQNSQIRYNVSNGDGGGVYSDSSNTEIDDSEISENTSFYSGGGVAVQNGSLLIDGSTLANNRSGVSGLYGGGGGLWMAGREAYLVNTTISGNTALYGNGGGMMSRTGSGPVHLINSTIANNAAGRSPTGAPLFGGGLFAISGQTLVINTIFDGNTAPGTSSVSMPSDVSDPNQSVFSLGNNLVSDPSNASLFNAVGDLVGQDARLAPLQDNGGPTRTHALLTGSPALDAGAPDGQNPAPNLSIPTVDQRGFGRPTFGAVDIGAFENQGPVANPDYASTPEETPVVIDILQNDSDVDGDSLEIERIVSVVGGQVEQNVDGTVTFTPDADFVGQAGFSYNVQDAFGNQSRTSVLIDVTPVNDPPVIADQTLVAAENSDPGTLVGSLSASDPEGDSLRYSVVGESHPGAFAVDSAGNVTVNDASLLDYETTSEFTLQVSVSDGALSSVATVTIELTDVFEDIDIQPGDDTNAISLKRGLVDVAMLSSDSFDPADIDVDSLLFGATGTEDSLSRHKKHQTPRVRYEDLNGDGVLDLIASFDVTLTGLDANDTDATLSGNTVDGESFAVTQSISVLQGKGNGGGGKGNGKGNNK